MNTYNIVRKRKRLDKFIFMFAVCIVLTFICVTPVSAATYEGTKPGISGQIGGVDFSFKSDEDGNGLSSTLQILLVLTLYLYFWTNSFFIPRI